MPVHWIIQENNRAPGTVSALVDAVLADGQIPHLVTLEPGAGIPAIEQLPSNCAIVCHGPGFVTRALSDTRYRSGLYFHAETFRWSVFRQKWQGRMLARDAILSTIPDTLASMRDGETRFVRPDADSKAFDGAIYNSETLQTATANWLGKTTQLVVASMPVKIAVEWRLFVVDGNIVAWSQYRKDGRATIDGAVPREAIEFGKDASAAWTPAPVFCLDLAMSEGRIGIVEANCFNASRFYGADTGAVVRHVSKFAAAIRFHAKVGNNSI